MGAEKNHSRAPALAIAALLALIVAALFSGTAAAQPRSGEDASPGLGEVREDGQPGVRGGVVTVRVLPGGEPPEQSDGEEPPPAEEPAPPGGDGGQKPDSKRLELTIPRLGMKNVELGDSPDQRYLDIEGIMHLTGTDFPWEDGPSNTYIVGHAIGYPGSRVREAFRNLVDLRDGDRVTLRDADGREYDYRVYQRLVVDPTDYWVTRPVPNKRNIVSLQTCYPEPTFEKRLIVRAALVE
jgi:sortase A